MIEQLTRADSLIYLDYNATTPLVPEVVKSVLSGLQVFGNPSSSHPAGKEAAEMMTAARSQVADWLRVTPGELVFTGSGSEAINSAIKGTALRNGNLKRHVITTRIEHSATLEACRHLQSVGCDVTYLPVDATGRVDPNSVRSSLRPNTCLISVMHANNETGVIQPVEEVAAIAKEADIPFLVDAVQTAGKMPIDIGTLSVDMVAISAHKFYGPKGIGALFVRRGQALTPLVHGGGQEEGRRGGTENLPAIMGFAAACARLCPFPHPESNRIRDMRDLLWAGLQDIGNVRLNGDLRHMLPGTLNVSFGNVRGDALALALGLQNIAVSTGSACHATRTQWSHVLEAMGVTGHWLTGAIRFSLGAATTTEQITYVARVIERTVMRLRSMHPSISSVGNTPTC